MNEVISRNRPTEGSASSLSFSTISRSNTAISSTRVMERNAVKENGQGDKKANVTHLFHDPREMRQREIRSPQSDREHIETTSDLLYAEVEAFLKTQAPSGNPGKGDIKPLENEKELVGKTSDLLYKEVEAFLKTQVPKESPGKGDVKPSENEKEHVGKTSDLLYAEMEAMLKAHTLQESLREGIIQIQPVQQIQQDQMWLDFVFESRLENSFEKNDSVKAEQRSKQQNEEKHYAKEFKMDSLQQLQMSGKNIEQVARDLGIESDTLRQWQNEYAKYDTYAFPEMVY